MFRTSYEISKDRSTSSNLIFNGNTTTLKSNWNTNGKLHSQPILDVLWTVQLSSNLLMDDEPHPLVRNQQRMVQSLYGRHSYHCQQSRKAAPMNLMCASAEVLKDNNLYLKPEKWNPKKVARISN
jgi:hypothetical protein